MYANNRIEQMMMDFVEEFDIEGLVDKAIDEYDVHRILFDRITPLIEETVYATIDGVIEDKIDEFVDSIDFTEFLCATIEKKAREVLY